MKCDKVLVLSLLVPLVFLSACGGDSGSNGNEGGPAPQSNRINWENVPTEFHPTIEDVKFSTSGIDTVKVDAFGFTNDAEVVYSDEVPAATGYVRIFKVWKKSASWGSVSPYVQGATVNIRSQGTYQCSIRIRNGQIIELEGGCYVRLQVFLPRAAEIEVYNVGQLISKRFIPISAETLLKNIDHAVGVDDKFASIDDFLNSYAGLSKVPTLTSVQLGEVIGEFSWKEEKLKALRMLHAFVTDRENLRQMIEKKFSMFEREEAFAIVGI